MAKEEDLAERLRKLQEHASRLEEKKRELERDLEDIDHKTRRLSDRRERGESHFELDQEGEQLSERRRVNLSDQGSTARDIDTLRQQREEVEEWIRQMRSDRNKG